MDKIQKFLVTAGRKDLAQEYYEKVAGSGFTPSTKLEQKINLLKRDFDVYFQDVSTKEDRVVYFVNPKFKVDELYSKRNVLGLIVNIKKGLLKNDETFTFTFNATGSATSEPLISNDENLSLDKLDDRYIAKIKTKLANPAG